MHPMLFRALLRLKNLHQGDIMARWRRIEGQQWLSRDELEEMAWQKRRALVAHAFANCPFYRRKYQEAGFQPGDLKTPEDFGRLPLLLKQEVREHIAEMVASGVEPARLEKKFTGGSTGIPLMVYHDRRATPLHTPLHLRTVRAWGLDSGEKTAHIWGLNPLNQEYLHQKLSRWDLFRTNYALLNAFTMDQDNLASFAALLRRFRPGLVISYTSAMESFARYLEQNGGAGFRPRAIWLTSEPIHDFQKALIERVLQTPVYNQYGSVEVFFMAAECGLRQGLHVNLDFRYLEIVDEEDRPLPPGQIGRVVVTDLANQAAPLIRYRNEDMSSLRPGACPCGRGLPLMNEITGRIYDMFILPDGSQVYGHRFTTFFYDHVDKVKGFQVHQTHRDRAVVSIVPGEGLRQDELSARLLEAFRGYTGGQMSFEVRYVQEIAKEASGKFRFAKSDVRVD